MKPSVVKFTADGTWTCPAGVTNVVVETKKYQTPPNQQTLIPEAGGGYNDTTIIIDSGNYLYLCGLNNNGQLGTNNVTAYSYPVIISTTSVSGSAKRVSANGVATYLITPTNLAYAMGINSYGQLGIGSLTTVSVPTIVYSGYNYSWCHVASSYDGYAFFLTPSGDLYGTGVNTYGNLGTNNVTRYSSPTLVVGGYKFRPIIAFTDNSSGYAVVALAQNGNAYAWGYDSNGGLGVGDLTPRSSPTLVVGGYTFKSIVSGSNCFFGLTTAGQLYAWGQNNSGQLGVGDLTPRSSPTLVVGGYTWQSIFSQAYSNAGTRPAFGITTSGILYSWGVNSSGSLGVGDVLSRSSPTLVVGGITNWKSILFNEYSAHGLTTTGQMYGWGSNSNGELGVGDSTSRSSPTLVVGGYTWKYMSAFYSGVTAVATNGLIYSWGYSQWGAGGLGTVGYTSSPTIIAMSNVGVLGPIINSQEFSVTPGTAYTIVMNSYNATFGGNLVGTDFVDEFNVTYY